MAEELLRQVQDTFEGQIDFEGQKSAELVSTVVLAIAGLLAFILGFVLQNIYVTLYVGLGGAVLAFLAVVPPYPFYNQHPENWLPCRSNAGGIQIEVDGKKVN